MLPFPRMTKTLSALQGDVSWQMDLRALWPTGKGLDIPKGCLESHFGVVSENLKLGDAFDAVRGVFEPEIQPKA